MKEFLRHFISMLATLSSVATLLSFSTGWQVKSGSIWIPIFLVLLILFICAFYASWQTRKKKKITLDINTSLKLTIQEANIFEQNGIIVIGVNEYFDTHVGDGIVSGKTLHGIFINKYYKDHLTDLDRAINESLQTQGVKPVESDCRRRHTSGKTDKYDLGTCALIHDGGKKYILVALTHFDENDKANMTRAELNHVLGKLMSFLDNHAEAHEVHMPILGAGLARLNRSSNRILNFTIDVLDFIHTSRILGGLYIDILSLKSANIDLNKIENQFINSIKE